MVISAERIEQRLERYYSDHQNGLHVTLLSVALAVAGLAAAGLLAAPAGSHPDEPLMWLLWTVTLVACATVYSGLTVNAFALPVRIPQAWDLLLPIAIGLAEFLSFGVLTPYTHFAAVRFQLASWLGAFAVLAGAASVVIRRARWLFSEALKAGEYSEEVLPAVCKLKKRLNEDAMGSTASSAVAAAGSLSWYFSSELPTDLGYAAAGMLALGLIRGICNHRGAARGFQKALLTNDVRKA